MHGGCQVSWPPSAAEQCWHVKVDRGQRQQTYPSVLVCCMALRSKAAALPHHAPCALPAQLSSMAAYRLATCGSVSMYQLIYERIKHACRLQADDDSHAVPHSMVGQLSTCGHLQQLVGISSLLSCLTADASSCLLALSDRFTEQHHGIAQMQPLPACLGHRSQTSQGSYTWHTCRGGTLAAMSICLKKRIWVPAAHRPYQADALHLRAAISLHGRQQGPAHVQALSTD